MEEEKKIVTGAAFPPDLFFSPNRLINCSSDRKCRCEGRAANESLKKKTTPLKSCSSVAQKNRWWMARRENINSRHLHLPQKWLLAVVVELSLVGKCDNGRMNWHADELYLLFLKSSSAQSWMMMTIILTTTTTMEEVTWPPLLKESTCCCDQEKDHRRKKDWGGGWRGRHVVEKQEVEAKQQQQQPSASSSSTPPLTAPQPASPPLMQFFPSHQLLLLLQPAVQSGVPKLLAVQLFRRSNLIFNKFTTSATLFFCKWSLEKNRTRIEKVMLVREKKKKTDLFQKEDSGQPSTSFIYAKSSSWWSFFLSLMERRKFRFKRVQPADDDSDDVESDDEWTWYYKQSWKPMLTTMVTRLLWWRRWQGWWWW